MANKTTLIFITAEYPYGKGETFIEAELKVLADHFDNIIIVPTEIGTDSNMGIRDFPSNCSISMRRSDKKSKSLFHIFGWRFIKMLFSEMRYIRVHLHLKFGLIHLKIAIKSYLSALIIKDRLEQESKKLNSEKLFIYSYWMGDGLLAAILARSCSLKPEAIRVFSRAHRWDLYFEVNTIPYLPWRRFMIGQSDAIFCISKDGQKYLSEKFLNFSKDKIQLAYLGVPAPPRSCKTPDFTLPGLRIISCSNVIKVKRVELILKAISNFTTQNIYWTHIGDGPLLKDLEEKAIDIVKNYSNIHISFAGHLSPAKRDELLASGAFHLFVNVSKSEGLPVSIMEAMSFGIPVLATAVGGAAEIVENGVNGLIIPENVTVQDLVSSLEYFNGMPLDMKQQWSYYAKQTWLSSFNSEKNHVKFAEKILAL